jgi:hypothetical protein
MEQQSRPFAVGQPSAAHAAEAIEGAKQYPEQLKAIRKGHYKRKQPPGPSCSRIISHPCLGKKYKR